METLSSQTLALCSLSLVVVVIARVVHTIWWLPKRLEKQLTKQGIRGTPYRLLRGDREENKRLMRDAWSKPMSLNHQIAARATPFVHQVVQKYGRTCFSWDGTTPRLMIVDPQLIRLVLNNKKGYFEKARASPLAYLLSRGLTALEGETWAIRRKLITPAFHYEKLQEMLPAFLVACSDMIDQWKKATMDGPKELDIAQEMQNLTADVISRAAFGSSYEEGKSIFELQKEQAVLAIESLTSIYLPGQRFIPTKKNKRRYEIDNQIKAVLREMIRKKEVAIASGVSEADDLLGLLLQCKTQAGNNLTIDDVIEECKLFHFAGQETTANWLAWTMIVLSMHPEWQERAREEVLQIFAKGKPDLETINHLKIVTMVLYEVLRLYPPAVNVFRRTKQKIDLGDISIPAGSNITLLILQAQHDPLYWGEDATEFRPERFAEGISKASKDPSAFNPFGWGPRICLGQNFAIIEAKLALSMILRQFSFELSPLYTHAPYTVVTLQPQHGAPMILRQILSPCRL